MYASLAAAALIAPVVAALLSTAPRNAPIPEVATCSWTPAGEVTIEPGEIQTFVSGGGFGCSGYSVSITPDNGTAGFSSGTDCTLTSVTTSGAGIFKVRGCNAGGVTVTIRSGSTVVQTISVVVQA